MTDNNSNNDGPLKVYKFFFKSRKYEGHLLGTSDDKLFIRIKDFKTDSVKLLPVSETEIEEVTPYHD